MTGRELIIYILQNNLEDEEILKDGVFVGLISAEEFAAMCGVGPVTVKVWYELGVLDGITIGDTIFFFKHAKNIGIANRLSKP